MPAIGPRSEWLPRHYMSHFLTNKSILFFTEVIPWPTAKTPTAAASAWRC